VVLVLVMPAEVEPAILVVEMELEVHDMPVWPCELFPPVVPKVAEP
jgi:hypothetical protein